MNQDEYRKLALMIAEKNKVSRTETQQVFMDAYDEHKTRFGSAKMLEGQEYYKAMSERYAFQFNKAIDYVRKEAERR